MARSTLTLLFVLGTISTILLGANISNRMSPDTEVLSAQDSFPSPTTTPTRAPQPTQPVRTDQQPPAKNDVSLTTVDGTTTLTDRGCGVSIEFPDSFVRQKTGNAGSKIFTDPARPKEIIALVCQDTIPEPPVSEEDTESTTLADVPAMLYHDKQADGSPRDEIIARHPTRNHDVIIAGIGPGFDQAVSSFTFLQ